MRDVQELLDNDEPELVKAAFKRDPMGTVYHAIVEELTAADSKEIAEIVYEAAANGLDGDEARVGQIIIETIRRYCREQA